MRRRSIDGMPDQYWSYCAALRDCAGATTATDSSRTTVRDVESGRVSGRGRLGPSYFRVGLKAFLLLFAVVSIGCGGPAPAETSNTSPPPSDQAPPAGAEGQPPGFRVPFCRALAAFEEARARFQLL